MDGDGWLDLAVGYTDTADLLFLNDGTGALQTTAIWTNPHDEATRDLAFGDLDGDGLLDLAIGGGASGSGGPTRVFVNTGTQPWFSTTASTFDSGTTDETTEVEWGDVDGDGDLDLVTLNSTSPGLLYENDGGVLQTAIGWGLSGGVGGALFDNNGDGKADAYLGLEGTNDLLYEGITGPDFSLPFSNLYSAAETASPYAVAIGDWNDDGDLDVALGTGAGGGSLVHARGASTLDATATWTSGDVFQTRGVAWADLNGSGYLDLVLGHVNNGDQYYLNDAVGPDFLPTAADGTASTSFPSEEIAMGDVDNDGDHDLAVAIDGLPVAIYLADDFGLDPWASGLGPTPTPPWRRRTSTTTGASIWPARPATAATSSTGTPATPTRSSSNGATREPS